MLRRGDQLITGAITLGEVLAKPYRIGHAELASRYEAFFGSREVTVIPFDLPAARHYARIRGDGAFSRADAMHRACAAAAQVDLFITNDERLHGKVVPGVKFVSSLMHAPI